MTYDMDAYPASVEEREIEWELPREIASLNPYVSIRDLSDMAAIFAPSLTSQEIGELEDTLQSIKEFCAPEGSTFYQTASETFAAELEARAQEELDRKDKTVGIVHMDRYIGKSQAGPRVGRLEISRDSTGSLTTRTGALLSIDQQLDEVAAMVQNQQLDELVFVDDVVAFGDTLPIIIRQMRERVGNTVDLRIVVGLVASGGAWSGLERVREATSIEVEYLTLVHASDAVEGGTKGMALPVSRDLTIFGGRVTTLEDAKLTHPYMMPFMKPLYSVMRQDVQLEASKRYLQFNLMLIDVMEQARGSTLYIGDLIDASVGFPYTSLECLQGIMQYPTSDMPVSDYIAYAVMTLDDNTEAILAECQPAPRKT